MYSIFVRELRAPAWIGIYDWEQRQPQVLEIDLDIEVGYRVEGASAAGRSDHIADTIDYGKVVERIRADLAARKFNLLEALAEHIAQVLLADFGAARVRVSVAKIAHMRDVKRVGVVIDRATPIADLPPGLTDPAAG